MFVDLEHSFAAQLAARAVFSRLPKGSAVFSKGDRGSNLYVLLTGAIRISAASADGKEGYLYCVFPGDVFGEVGMLDGKQRTTDAVAMEASEMIAIERRDFLPVLRASPDLAMRLINVLCAHLRKSSEAVEDIACLNLPRRLAKALLSLHEESNQPKVIRITQNHISQMIGATRESTNKQLQVWKRMNILTIKRTGIVLRKPHLLLDWR